MASALENILGYNTLTGLLQLTVNGLPKVLPDGFYKSNQKVLKDTGTYTTVRGQRKVARIMISKDAPLANYNKEDIGVKPFKCITAGQKVDFHVSETYLALRRYASYDPQQIGNDEIGRQIKLFGTTFDNLRTAVIMQALVKGAIHYDRDGALLPTSSGAYISADFGVPAGNKDQLDTDGTGDIITSSWANPEANIPVQLNTLIQRAVFAHGYEPGIAVYGRNIPQYFSQNAYVQEYMARQDAMRGEFLTNNTVPNGLFGFDWIPGWKSFYESNDGTQNPILGDDQVVFFPKDTADWYELVEGSTAVPTSIQINQNPESMLSQWQEKHGMVMFGYVTSGPWKIVLEGFDVFSPILKNGNVVYQATVAGF